MASLSWHQLDPNRQSCIIGVWREEGATNETIDHGLIRGIGQNSVQLVIRHAERIPNQVETGNHGNVRIANRIDGINVLRHSGRSSGCCQGSSK